MKIKHLRHERAASTGAEAGASRRNVVPFCAKRAALGVLLAALACLGGCTGASDGPPGGTRALDADVLPDSDSGGAGPTANEGGLGRVDGGVPRFEEGIADTIDALSGSDADRVGCYDGLDNDGDGVFDCADPGCARTPACCVAGESLACCTSPERSALPVERSCTGRLASCAPAEDFLGFGEPAARFERGAFLPLGDATGDSGAILVKRFDPASGLVVRGTLATPIGACGAGCFESVGLGLVTEGAPGPAGSVRPWVGVVASASRADLALVVAGDVVDRLAITGDGRVAVELTVLPTGSVRLDARLPGVDMPFGTLTARVTPRTAPVQLALYGRGTNVSAAGMTSEASDVSVESLLCPSPSGWLTRDALATPLTAPAAPNAPAVAYGGGQTLLAWEQDGIIQLRVLLVERLAPGTELPSNGPALFAPDASFADPDVHVDATGGGPPRGYSLYVANRTTGAIERVALDVDGMPTASRTTVASPAELGLIGVEALDGPSVLRPASPGSGIAHLFARARLTSGETRLVRFAMSSALPTATVVGPVDLDAATVRVQQPGFGAFDRDELAAPSAYRHDGGVQLAFAGRSGARWAIGLMSTDLGDFSAWHTEPTTPILAGDAAGFDALTVRDPAVVARGADIEMLYIGSDGARDVIGLATRRAPDRASR
jgi:hypothetical protein